MTVPSGTAPDATPDERPGEPEEPEEPVGPDAGAPDAGAPAGPGGLHHVELWVADLAAAERSWGWLLSELDWQVYQDWPDGRSWRRGTVYIVIERSPALTARTHERTRPGLNHLALHAGTPADVDRLYARAPEHGWSALFAERYPHAGGPGHYAAYLQDIQGFEAELVATAPTGA